MNTSNLADRSAFSRSTQLVPVTEELLETLGSDKLRLGDVLTCTDDGEITGFWRSQL